MATTVQSTANSEGKVDEKKSEDKMATTVRDQSTANSEGIVDGKKSDGISDKVIQESDVANKKCDIPDKMATTGCDQSTADGNGKGDEKKSEGIPDKVSQNLDKANKKPEKPDKMTNTGSDQSTVNIKGKEDGKKSDDISDKVLKELDEAYKKQGIPGITDRVKANLDDWKSVPLNIAVIGNSGVGKSSYINALLGLSADDKGAAPVGVVETTVTLTPFSHPGNKNLTLWDLPGVGTPNFPKDGYLQKINFKKYDFFLVLTATRFTENDIWLAQKIRDLGKKFYLIRTKIDMDISNDKKAHPNTHYKG
ncbi:T-cell-specific guanine nucleotide triphosphate-binding protein 2-like isoform X2 [Mercenaria mercenaria]|uniref:T-cell-specific guanine nucleotide triphosphate-binding protein 2-like isoform X2 n=1 Tax=Mercenaria mercenaria TaxID=6596 RepID=UPI00234F3D59|nr:T-cell-specific guanine nucleotide triphosphate-binding protein 2-like isoform X2 [Mercenaria mercenaria]